MAPKPALFGGALARGSLVRGQFLHGDGKRTHSYDGIVVAGDANRKERLFVLFQSERNLVGYNVYPFAHQSASVHSHGGKGRQGSYPHLQYGKQFNIDDQSAQALRLLKNAWDVVNPSLMVSGACREEANGIYEQVLYKGSEEVLPTYAKHHGDRPVGVGQLVWKHVGNSIWHIILVTDDDPTESARQRWFFADIREEGQMDLYRTKDQGLASPVDAAFETVIGSTDGGQPPTVSIHTPQPLALRPLPNGYGHEPAAAAAPQFLPPVALLALPAPLQPAPSQPVPVQPPPPLLAPPEPPPLQPAPAPVTVPAAAPPHTGTDRSDRLEMLNRKRSENGVRDLTAAAPPKMRASHEMLTLNNLLRCSPHEVSITELKTLWRTLAPWQAKLNRLQELEAQAQRVQRSKLRGMFLGVPGQRAARVPRADIDLQDVAEDLPMVQRHFKEMGIGLSDLSQYRPRIQLEEAMRDIGTFFNEVEGNEGGNADCFIIQFSGHGAERTGDLMLAQSGFISFDRMLQEWEASQAKARNGLLVLVLDSCFSGAWVKQARERQLSDVAVQSACSATEVSWDGVFTQQLIHFQQSKTDKELALNVLRVGQKKPMNPDAYVPWQNAEIPIRIGKKQDAKCFHFLAAGRPIVAVGAAGPSNAAPP